MSVAFSRVALDRICQIAARNLRSSIALIVDCDPTVRGNVLGSIGCIQAHLPGNLRIPTLSTAERDIAIFNDIQNDGRFQSHPIRKAFSGARSLLAVSIFADRQGEQKYLLVVNPSSASCRNIGTSPLLADLTSIAGAIIDLAGNHGAPALQSGDGQQTLYNSYSFHENFVSADFADVDSAARFLLESLVSRNALHSLRDITYVTARKWRMPLREKQLSAFQALLHAPCPGAERTIANEIVEIVDRTFLKSSYVTVVPIPDNNQGSGLSLRLAEQVAGQLRIPLTNCLLAVRVKKGMPPTATRTSVSFDVSQPLTGAVLLVAAASSSGREIEAAASALRLAGADPTAIAWLETGKPDQQKPKPQMQVHRH